MIDWQTFEPLLALTHLDGRNGKKLVVLRAYFSEYAWTKRRIGVIVAHALAVQKACGETPSKNFITFLTHLVNSFSLSDAKIIQGYEKIYHHDLKAIEFFIEQKIQKSKFSAYKKFVMLGIGSEDINNIALRQTLLDCIHEVMCPAVSAVGRQIAEITKKEKQTFMAGRTHGQPANVTSFGKEMAVFLSRLIDSYDVFYKTRFRAKCSGEIGSFQAQWAANTDIDWVSFEKKFLSSYALTPAGASTQIAPYDDIIVFLQAVSHVNTVLLDFSKNMWLYGLLGFIKTRPLVKEVGSAGMPHKVNPIFFEGAEGGLLMANGLIDVLVKSLSTNRLQRDFSDSTVRRNLPLIFAYSLLSYQSVSEAIDRTVVDRQEMTRDMNRHAEIFAETIKSFCQYAGVEHIYDFLKEKMRGKTYSSDEVKILIKSLPLTSSQKKELEFRCFRLQNPYPARIALSVVKRAHKTFRL